MENDHGRNIRFRLDGYEENTKNLDSANDDGRISPFRLDGYEENKKNLESVNDGTNSRFRLDAYEENLKNLEPGNGIVTGGHFNHDDITGMLDNPPKYTGHRRAHSEVATILDDISFDSDLGVVGCSQETEEDFFSSKTTNAAPLPENRVNKHHQHSMSMDGSSSTACNQEETLSADAKKWMADNKLADVALVDPKRAKRIWANRQSAARSKQRKIFYIAELERKVHTLQTEKSSISARLPHLQREIHILSAENNDLKLRLQAMVQQAHLQDAMTDSLRKEIHQLQVVTGQNLTNGGPMVNFPPLLGSNQFHPITQPVNTMLTSQQFQQLQFQSQNQNHVFQQQPLQQFQHQQQHFQQQQHNHG